MTPYSQGNRDFKVLAKKRADNIFKKYDFYTDIYCTNEIICSNFTNMLQKYKGKKILILGGGPSTNEFLDNQENYKTNIEDYDYLWSANHFFLNKTLKNIKIDLAMIMLEPDIFSKEFVSYYEKFKPTLGFELHSKWKNLLIPYNDSFVMQTRFYGILGACQRMMIFAAILQADTIGFIGLDGLSAIKKGEHSFQPGKTKMPSISNEQIYKNQYLELWKYMYQFKDTTKLINIKKIKYKIQKEK